MSSRSRTPEPRTSANPMQAIMPYLVGPETLPNSAGPSGYSWDNFVDPQYGDPASYVAGAPSLHFSGHYGTEQATHGRGSMHVAPRPVNVVAGGYQSYNSSPQFSNPEESPGQLLSVPSQQGTPSFTSQSLEFRENYGYGQMPVQGMPTYEVFPQDKRRRTMSHSPSVGPSEVQPRKTHSDIERRYRENINSKIGELHEVLLEAKAFPAGAEGSQDTRSGTSPTQAPSYLPGEMQAPGSEAQRLTEPTRRASTGPQAKKADVLGAAIAYVKKSEAEKQLLVAQVRMLSQKLRDVRGSAPAQAARGGSQQPQEQVEEYEEDDDDDDSDDEEEVQKVPAPPPKRQLQPRRQGKPQPR